MISIVVFITALFTVSYYINRYEEEKKAHEESELNNLLLLKKIIDDPKNIESARQIFNKYARKE